MSTSIEVDKHAAAVIGAIDMLPADAALLVLHSAIGVVISRLSEPGTFERPLNPIFIRSELLRDRRSRRSKIDKDPEVREFIHSLRGELRLEDIIAACKQRFAPHRVPSRSSLSRYISQLKYRCGIAQDGRND